MSVRMRLLESIKPGLLNVKMYMDLGSAFGGLGGVHLAWRVTQRSPWGLGSSEGRRKAIRGPLPPDCARIQAPMPDPVPALILVCDHRGRGLGQRLAPLASPHLRLETSSALTQTQQRIVREPPALVVIDPLSKGGVVELEALRAAAHRHPVPILLVASANDPLPALIAARTLDPGPWDLIARSAPIEEYSMRIERLRRQADRERELETIRFAASHDDRTALLRPVPFDTRLKEQFSAATRHHMDLALILIDLDNFGQVNKVFDHTVGDAVIELVGQVITENLRTEDVGGRIGGDEFAVVLPFTPRLQAARVVARLREEIFVLSGPYPETDLQVEISASIGFETYDGTDVESVEAMRRHAEIALRRCKEKGGNQALYYRQLPEVRQEQNQSRGA